ncbi:MAG: hypothetical protein AB1730_20360 [Myxococcota bacterium]
MLAAASRALNRPLPASIVALADLAESGELKPVDALTAKLDAVRGWAPGVTRCIVTKAQAALVREAGFEVATCDTALELIDEVFPSRPGDPGQDPEERSRRLLVLVARPTRPVLAWARVEDEARRIAEDPGASESARWRATLVADVAARHDGRPRPSSALDRDPPEDLPRPLRDQLVAQRVQHLCDSGADDQGLVTRLLDELPAPVEASTTQLEILGALGRALARRREYRRAQALLEKVVGAWVDIGDARQASHPLTEWARVVGILEGVEHDVEFRGRLEAAVVPVARRVQSELRLDDRGQAANCYLALALGRACTQVGDLAGAADWWDSAEWSWAHDWVHPARERWMARGQWEAGRRDEALHRLRAIRGGADLVALAGLDAAHLAGEPVTEALEAFLRTDGRSETAWLLGDADSTHERARRLVFESPY